MSKGTAEGHPFNTASRAKMRSATRKTERAINDGLLVRPLNCSMCGITKKRILAHHPDYNKPLNVIWLCPFCHQRVHTLAYHLAQDTPEVAATGGTEGQEGITPETLAAIKEAIGATGIALSRPYEVLRIVPDFPLENLGETEGQEVLGWYKSQ